MATTFSRPHGIRILFVWHRLHTDEKLREAITNKIGRITQENLQNVVDNMKSRINMRLDNILEISRESF